MRSFRSYDRMLSIGTCSTALTRSGEMTFVETTSVVRQDRVSAVMAGSAFLAGVQGHDSSQFSLSAKSPWLVETPRGRRTAVNCCDPPTTQGR